MLEYAVFRRGSSTLTNAPSSATLHARIIPPYSARQTVAAWPSDAFASTNNLVSRPYNLLTYCQGLMSSNPWSTASIVVLQ